MNVVGETTETNKQRKEKKNTRGEKQVALSAVQGTDGGMN